MKKWLILTIGLLLTGCGIQEQKIELPPPDESGIPAQDISAALETVEFSPTGRYVARAKVSGGLAITVTDTEDGQIHTVTLPDGAAISEKAELVEMEWLDHQKLEITAGLILYLRENGETTRYRYHPGSDTAAVETVTLVEGDWDFDHDGTVETLELHTVEDNGACCELWLKEGEDILWADYAHYAHVAWNTILSCEIDGEDYLLRYNPYMNMGAASYCYEVFSLDGAGNEVCIDSELMEFETNYHHVLDWVWVFEPTDITAFFKNVCSYLENATLLMSTEDGDVWPLGMSGVDFFWETVFFDLPEDSADWEQFLTDYRDAEVAAYEAWLEEQQSLDPVDKGSAVFYNNEWHFIKANESYSNLSH